MIPTPTFCVTRLSDIAVGVIVVLEHNANNRATGSPSGSH